MSEALLQFGPTWARNGSADESEDGGPSGMPVPTRKYRLADHRYGREEMLALFTGIGPAPEPLRSSRLLYVERVQEPLSLQPMVDEEARIAGIQSGIVQKPAFASMHNGMSGTRGGRTVDRGRGRATGRSSYYYGPRYTEDSGVAEQNAFGSNRARAFDRNQNYNERGWTERNGNSDYNDWNGVNDNLSTSPRKEFGLTVRSSSKDEGNWRRRPARDEDDWRNTRQQHGRGYSNWRESPDKEKKEDDGLEPPRDRRWMGRIMNLHSDGNNRKSEPKYDLPEWATERATDSGGTFDAAGAFHGSDSEDDDVEYEKKRKSKSKSAPDKYAEKKTPPKNKDSSQQNKRTDEKNSKNNNGTSERTTPAKKERARSPPKLSDIQKNIAAECVPPVPVNSSKAPQKNARSPTIPTAPASQPVTTSGSPSVAAVTREAPTANTVEAPHSSHDGTAHAQPDSERAVPERRVPSSVASAQTEKSVLITPADLLSGKHVTRLADVEQRTANSLGYPIASNILPEAKPEGYNNIKSMVFSHTGDNEKNMVQSYLEKINKWYYKDPQGIERGPFRCAEMTEWYSLGYFQDNMLIRRGSDHQYYFMLDLALLLPTAPFIEITSHNLEIYESVNASLRNTSISLTAIPPPTLPSRPISDQALLMQRYQQQQHQINLNNFMKKRAELTAPNVLHPLAQPDRLNIIPPMDKERLLMQQMANNIPSSQGGNIPTIPSFMNQAVPRPVVPPNPDFLMLFSQMQQHQQQQIHQEQPFPVQANQSQAPNQDQVQEFLQLMEKMGNANIRKPSSPVHPQVSNIPAQNRQTASMASSNTSVQTPVEDPMHILLKNMNMNMNLRTDKTDGSWATAQGGPPPPVTAQSIAGSFDARNWVSQVGRIGPGEDGWWDKESVPTTSAMRTEQQIIQEALLASMKRVEDTSYVARETASLEINAKADKEEREKYKKKLQQERKVEEEKKKLLIAEENLKKQREKDQLKAQEEAKRKAAEEAKRKEERLRKEEEKRRKEEKEKKRKAEEEKRKLEEEKRKKQQQEEKKRKEEEKKRQEEQKKRAKEKEEKQKELKKQEEALQRLKEQQQLAASNKQMNEQKKKQPQQMPIPKQLSKSQSSVIQKSEPKKPDVQSSDQMTKLMKTMSTPSFGDEQQPAKKEKKKKNKDQGTVWTEANRAPVAKSLAEIQAEEQRELTKQIEREKAERALLLQQQALEEAAERESRQTNIWCASTPAPWENPVWSFSQTSVAGPSKTTNHVQAKPVGNKASSKASSSANTTDKKPKKDEAKKEMTKNQWSSKHDDLVKWSVKALSGIHTSVDVPTFVGFLRDVESANDVREYVIDSLGDTRETGIFVAQFLEKRRAFQKQPPKPKDTNKKDDKQTVSKQNSTEFTEVKGKAKKLKKKTMLKVDKSLLGFSGTTDPDRRNVGERDYGDLT